MGYMEGVYCALCGMPVESGKGISTKDWGNKELYFCGPKCSEEFRKKYDHLSRSTKFMEDLVPAKSELGKVARDFLLGDAKRVVSAVNDAGFGAVTGLVGSAVAAYNSPEAKARRAEAAAERKRREEESFQESLEEQSMEFFNFDPNGKFKDVKKMTIFAIHEFNDFVKETFSSSYLTYYLRTISQIRRVCVTGIESIRNENPGLADKLQKKYEKLLGYLAAKNEVDYIQQKTGMSVSQVQAHQKALNDNLLNARKALPAYKTTSAGEITKLQIKSLMPFIKVTKEDVANAKAERNRQIELLKKNIVDAKNDIASNMKGLKEKEAQLKKEGNKELAAAKKALSRFKMGFPSEAQLAHALAFAKENNV